LHYNYVPTAQTRPYAKDTIFFSAPPSLRHGEVQTSQTTNFLWQPHQNINQANNNIKTVVSVQGKQQVGGRDVAGQGVLFHLAG